MLNESKKNKIIDEDSELITAINSGQQELFYSLVDKYSGRLYNFGLKMCKNVQDAEDMVQDTFLNVFRYAKDFRFETKFRNWLYRIAASACIKKKRRSKFAPEKELSLEDLMAAESAATSDEPPLWAAQPLEKVLNRELGETLSDAILKLPEKYRLVLVLRDIEGFSTSETAQILNLSEANIKVRLHRARLFLKDELKGYFEDGQI
jgi:RNA polymerase sigma-70 factor (ECF subfamily)